MKSVLQALLLLTASASGFAQVNTIALASTNAVGAIAWPDGTWYVRAILVDDMGVAVGDITDQISFALSGSYPSIDVTMGSDAPMDYEILFYRSQSPFNGGDTNIETNSITCPIGEVCNSATVDSVAITNTLNGGWSTATVLPVTLQRFEID